MTTPAIAPLIWATLKVNQEGFSFALVSSTNGTTAQYGTRVLLPKGVNLIMVDWMGQSKALVQAGVSAALQRIEIPAATSQTRRSVMLRVPADAPDAFISITTYSNAPAEVGQVMGGITITPTNLT